MSGRQHLDLFRRCSAAIQQLDVPAPFDLDVYLDRLARSRGRPIHRIPEAGLPGDPCGWWVAADGADYIHYHAGTSPLHLKHIVLHETGHMVLAHRGECLLGNEVVGELFGDLDPQLVHQALGEIGHTTAEEQAAEIFAVLIGTRSGSPPSGSAVSSSGAAGALDRVEATFG